MERRKEKLALIHLARKDIGLDDEGYRALLFGTAGVESAADITTETQFDTVMCAFAKLGFVRRPGTKRLPLRSAQIPHQGPYGLTDEKRATTRQLYYIKGLWELASRAKDERSLRAMVKRIGHVDDLKFLPRDKASAVILALRDICWKAGINPDGPGRERPSEGTR